MRSDFKRFCFKWTGLAAGVFMLAGVCGCSAIAAGGSGSAAGRNANAASDSGPSANASAMARGPSGSDSSTPPDWPWRGVALIAPGATPANIDLLKNSLNINSVHLYLQISQISERENLTPKQAWDKAMGWLDRMLAECRKDGVVAIVSFRSFPKPGGGFYNHNSSSFWDNSAAVNEIYTQVAALADHLRHYGSEFAAYDIINEPVVRTPLGPQSPPDWNHIQAKIVQTLRSHDPNRWIVVSPGPWGGAPGYRDWSPLNFPRLVYSVHIYVPHAYTHQGIGARRIGLSYPGRIGKQTFDKQALRLFLAPVIRFHQRYGVPVYVGEFSAVRWAPGSGQYLRDLVSIFDANGWGWAYFSMGGFNGWDPRYDSTYTPNKVTGAGHEVGTSSPRWQTLESLFGSGG